jgi:uncharacterized protein (TIGR00369 family)
MSGVLRGCASPGIVSGVCEAAGMSDTAMINRSGPFWEFLAGRQSAPPAAMTLGWELSWVAPERGEIEVFFDARADFANPMGNVQGGFLAAMLDDTLGPALAATLGEGEFAATLELKVSFLRPAAPGRITGTGRVVHRGGSIAFLAGELRDETGDVLAIATATVRIIRPHRH